MTHEKNDDSAKACGVQWVHEAGRSRPGVSGTGSAEEGSVGEKRLGRGADVYTKTETNSLLSSKANSSTEPP